MSLLFALLHAKRKALGLTLQEVADQIGSSKSYIWELEHDASEPSIGKVVAIARALKLSPKSIFDAVESRIPSLSKVAPKLKRCAANYEGECNALHCPQLRDGEPKKTGRSCPLPGYDGENE